MSGWVEWMAAQGEDAKRGVGRGLPPIAEQRDVELRRTGVPYSESWQKLPVHNFPARRESEGAAQEEGPLDRNPDLWLYRERTVGLLRRYMRFSLETGRLPSLAGREFFRAKVTFYRAATFEDRVIFVRDVEACLNRLEYLDQQLIARVILQEYSLEEAARLLHCSRRTIQRRAPEVIDLISERFLKVGLLADLPAKKKV